MTAMEWLVMPARQLSGLEPCWMAASRTARTTFWSEGLQARRPLRAPRLESTQLCPSIAEHPVDRGREQLFVEEPQRKQWPTL